MKISLFYNRILYNYETKFFIEISFLFILIKSVAIMIDWTFEFSLISILISMKLLKSIENTIFYFFCTSYGYRIEACILIISLINASFSPLIKRNLSCMSLIKRLVSLRKALKVTIFDFFFRISSYLSESKIKLVTVSLF